MTTEPAEGSPGRGLRPGLWLNRVLVTVLLAVAVIEAKARPDLVWWHLAVVVALGLVVSLLWRRSHAFSLVLAAFAVLYGIKAVSVMFDVRWSGLYTNLCTLLLIYSLARRDPWLRVVVGLVFVEGGALLIILRRGSVPEAVAASVLLLSPAVVGLAVRLRAESRAREIEGAKLAERAQLARELHDTVAHHVSAIILQAQAGRTVAAKQPEAAAGILEVIEEEAGRTLAEMRNMVRVLRHQDEAAALAPVPSLGDLADLARGDVEVPVDVQLSGNLDGVTPAVGAALYRIAQESMTNAVRHARGATQIAIKVEDEGEHVRLTVNDDGGSPSLRESRGRPGFGLIGMAERAQLLGGTFEAGPGQSGGWSVQAVLPRRGRAK